LSFKYEDEKVYSVLGEDMKKVVYFGWRPVDSLAIHERFAKNSYPFTFPAKDTYMMINITRKLREKYLMILCLEKKR